VCQIFNSYVPLLGFSAKSPTKNVSLVSNKRDRKGLDTLEGKLDQPMEYGIGVR